MFEQCMKGILKSAEGKVMHTKTFVQRNGDTVDPQIRCYFAYSPESGCP